MGDDSLTMAAILTGAVLGGVAGYLFFTDRGRALRLQLEPAVEDFARELSGFRGTIQRAIGVATQSWDVAGDSGRGIH
jgi:hypothetical protein